MPAQCITKPLEYEDWDPPGVRSSHPQPYSCKPPAIQGHSLVKRTKPPGSAGVPPATLFLQAACDPGPLPRTAQQTPRERGRPARNLVRANSLRFRATPSQSAANRPLRCSLPLCQVVCGRDARAPGWVSPPASLFVRTACDPGPLPRTAQQTHLCGLRYHCAKSCASETPALPGGCLRPQAHSCKQPPIRGQPLGGKTLAIALSGSISDWVGNRLEATLRVDTASDCPIPWKKNN